jgi:hypothetical protein
MLRLLILFLALYYSCVALAQIGNMPPNPQPGKCYAKCLIPDVPAKPADTTYTVYRLYSGSDDIAYNVKYHDVSIDEYGTVQERIPVEVPKKLRKLREQDVVLDTMYTFHAPTEGKKGGFTEWREILCGGDVTPTLVRELSDALRANGYAVRGEHTVASSEVKKALLNYQRDNGLPAGHLDFQTLDALGVNY